MKKGSKWNAERAVSRIKATSPDRLPVPAAELTELVLQYAEDGHRYDPDSRARRIVEAIQSFDRGDLAIQDLRRVAESTASAAAK